MFGQKTPNQGNKQNNSRIKESKSSSHGSPLGNDEIKLTRENLNWPFDSFEIPKNLMKLWRNFSNRNKEINGQMK